LRVGGAAGCRRDALGPASGVTILLIGEADEDVSSLGIAFSIGEVAVGRSSFDFPLPHLLNCREILRIHATF